MPKIELTEFHVYHHLQEVDTFDKDRIVFKPHLGPMLIYRVAQVLVPDNNIDQQLERCFLYTNSIDSSWYGELQPSFIDITVRPFLRSTSTGDLIHQVMDNRWFIARSVGFTELSQKQMERYIIYKSGLAPMEIRSPR